MDRWITLADATVRTAGAKAGTLGTLLRRGFPVPAGVVLPVDLPDDDLATVCGAVVAALGGGALAVRSSAASEDSVHGSAAGQLTTVLAVTGTADLVAAVRRVRASVRSERYRAYAGEAADGGTAVLVQQLVDADVAGVLFTADPALPGGTALLEAGRGLGEPVVSGRVTPERYRVTAGGAVRWEPGRQDVRLDRRDDRLVTSPVAPALRGRRTLDDRTVREVVALGDRAGALLGGPLDVEWALAGGRLWLLQARPVTAAVPGAGPSTVPGGALVGVPASPGTAVGPVRVVRGPADFGRIRAGDVLVCAFTEPAWTPLLGVVAAVVTAAGGLLSHAAIVARERRVPAVVGVPGVLGAFADGQVVRVDGSAGTVEPLPR